MSDSVLNPIQPDRAVSNASFIFLSELIKKHSGLVLTEDKIYLLEARLAPVIKRHNLPTLDRLAEQLKVKNDAVLLKDVIAAMTINETSFFRDIKPFKQLSDLVIPQLLASERTDKKIRILSAACSSGQEPYSIAMTLLEDPGLTPYSCEITAIDLAQHIIDKAAAGVYSQFEVQRGLPITMLIKYFTQEGDIWHIKDNVKSMVKFRQCNLLEIIADLGMFDIIFCRNVLIYFDQPTKSTILGKLSTLIKPGGFLFLGMTESTVGLCDQFKPIEHATGLHISKQS